MCLTAMRVFRGAALVAVLLVSMVSSAQDAPPEPPAPGPSMTGPAAKNPFWSAPLSNLDFFLLQLAADLQPTVSRLAKDGWARDVRLRNRAELFAGVTTYFSEESKLPVLMIEMDEAITPAGSARSTCESFLTIAAGHIAARSDDQTQANFVRRFAPASFTLQSRSAQVTAARWLMANLELRFRTFSATAGTLFVCYRRAAGKEVRMREERKGADGKWTVKTTSWTVE